MTDRYAVIGNPVAHSKSPQIHAEFARLTGQDLSYERLLAPLGGFADTAMRFAREGGLGLNVTVPFKLDAFALARERSDRAQLAGACNTLAWRGTHWYGDNTDGVGVLRDLTHNLGVAIAGRDLLVMGAGGAARGILGPLAEAGPRTLVITNRTMDKARELAALFAAHGPIVALTSAELAGRRFDVVINATSSGLVDAGAGSSPWPDVGFAPGGFAYDLVYGDAAASFLRWAKERGAAGAADGLGMLIEQAAESFLIWRGVRPDTASAFALLRRPTR
jgi:shikimate dehydrogenase